MHESEQFSTEVTQVDGVTVIHVYGEIDLATCGRLRDVLEPHLGPKQSIVMDLSGVRFMDSSCLNLLVQARGTLTADGGSLILRNPSAMARRLLTAARIEHLLDDDLEPATNQQATQA
jgi:anti-anti-sigma factor